MTCNVRGLSEIVKRKAVFNYLHNKDVDIVFFQETHSTKKKERYGNHNGGAHGF